MQTAPSAAEGAKQEQLFAPVCAARELQVLTFIDDHGRAEDMPSVKLFEAALAMMDARSACYRGEVAEALAQYDGILRLGPVASRRMQ